MAAPPEITIKNLNGKFTMNKYLSGDIDAILTLQGMSWFFRKTVGIANVTLYVTQSEVEGITHIDIKQIATAGIEVSPENRVLDWTERSQDDKIFGKVVGRSRWTKLEELDVTDAEDKKWLTEGWDEDGEKVEARVVSENAGWNVIAIWGFTHIEETRYYTRKMVIRNNKGKVIRDKIIYDYLGVNDYDDDY